MAERLSVRAGGGAGRHSMGDGDMVMNDEDRKFVVAVRHLGDTTHYMGVPIGELPGLPAKLKEAQSRAEKAEAEFKNFHRMLCERFGYSHDERHWKRDQVSLMEDIATALTAERQRAEAQNAKLRRALDAAAGWFKQYAYTHSLKDTPEGNDKARKNQARAMVLRAALDEAEGNGE